MDLLKAIFFDPFFNALIALYNVVGDLGIAIIIITVLVRVAMLPLANKALRSQRRLQALQPELAKLQKKHKDEREVLAKEVMAFYKKEGVNPASSCLPTLVQIPLLVALFFVFKDAAASSHLDQLYPFVTRPDQVDPTFLGLVDLSKPDFFVLPVITALLQFWQSRMLMPKGDGVPAINRQLVYILPLVTLVFATTLPAALPLYWASSTLFSVGQQYYVLKALPEPKARREAVADWNAANPGDVVNGGKDAAKSAKSSKKKGATVTVRKRGS